MTTLKIYNLDDSEENVPVSVLAKGEHIIGREKLNCKDKRVSRNHALIVITEDSVTLKSTHINPSFYKPNGGNSIQLVKKDSIITLNDGDQFSLLPQEFWFRIRVTKIEEVPEQNRYLKRTHVNETCEESNKKPKFNTTDNDTSQISKSDLLEDSSNHATLENSNVDHHSEDLNPTVQDSVTTMIENPSNEKTTATVDTNSATDHKLHHKEISDSEESLDFGAIEPAKVSDSEESLDLGANEPTKTTKQSEETTDVNKNDVDDETPDANQNNPVPTSPKTKRNRCWYKDKCYRKNPAHRTQFSHPGDDDYDTDDDCPVCPFGDTCYRTNLIHREQYKHSKPPAPKPVANNNTTATNNISDSSDTDDGDATNTGKKKRKAAAKPKKYAETPGDDYDIEDPFINDASSDDFQISGSGSDDSDDTEWQDTQVVDEESQETRRLLKEAKKFTKKKNKK